MERIVAHGKLLLGTVKEELLGSTSAQFGRGKIAQLAIFNLGGVPIHDHRLTAARRAHIFLKGNEVAATDALFDLMNLLEAPVRIEIAPAAGDRPEIIHLYAADDSVHLDTILTLRVTTERSTVEVWSRQITLSDGSRVTLSVQKLSEQAPATPVEKPVFCVRRRPVLVEVASSAKPEEEGADDQSADPVLTAFAGQVDQWMEENGRRAVEA